MVSRLRPGAAAGRRLLRDTARPLRDALGRPRPAGAPAAPSVGRYDGWLALAAGEQLERLDADCRATTDVPLARFSGLDADVWALLLTQEYEAYPGIRAVLPEVPEPGLQQMWNGASGAGLAAQGATFYRRLRERFAQHGRLDLGEAAVLDFGCGWGRLTRMLARDVPPERLFGCDPSPEILAECTRSGVPARFAQSELMPERVPFEESFDLAYAFSVFTHLSEPAHERCLRALHSALRPGGILVVTVRPPEYLDLSELMAPARRRVGPDEPAYLFVPHAADPSHPQYQGGEMTYGEAVVTVPYVRERWSERFTLLAVDILLDDLFQVVLTLRRT